MRPGFTQGHLCALMATKHTELSKADASAMLALLKARFEKNPGRHPDIRWSQAAARLEAAPGKLWSLQAMEASGGEPDVVGTDSQSGSLVFMDCSPETPAGRRSLCYDQKALAARKHNPPAGSAEMMAETLGVSLLTESDYLQLQLLGLFDLKTSSWLKTPVALRNLGGALFGDRRYDRVFVYHNGAASYYAVRGFRAKLLV